MSLIRWDPFDDLVSLRETINRMFDDTFARRGAPGFFGGRVWQPSVDMYETENDIVIKANLPGMDPKDVDITLTDNAITIRGEMKQEKAIDDKAFHRRERMYGAFSRTLPLTSPVKREEAKASFKNGVLEVVLPKAEEARGKGYKINIQ
ncbi:MAG TPA: Hsp20/alpha crystallin family protein [Firmicutes bacterium]|nr:Hsp20/alpha crystallin family protein [Bacillota bacterium]